MEDAMDSFLTTLSRHRVLALVIVLIVLFVILPAIVLSLASVVVIK
jgi:hypothetical protein